MIQLPAESLGRKLNHMNSLCRKPFFVDGSLGRKQEITDISAEAKYDAQSRQEGKLADSLIPCEDFHGQKLLIRLGSHKIS